jgi:hypothetical protein
VRLARGLIARQDHDALEKGSKEQIDRSNARGELAGQTDHGQVVQHRVPIGWQVGPLLRAQVGGSETSQGAMQTVGLLARRAQALAGLRECRRKLTPRRGDTRQAGPRLCQALAQTGSRGLKLGQPLRQLGQASLAIASPRLVDC